ncbi:crossover junction endodeoxyribonuclease RuvC [Candidatus Parcubacteria bacterium]|nr:crossover junction endodeoxyribonuclease RuvC [Candidatus Parcubacteria bacterium]
MIIIGIDPGIATTGYGIIKKTQKSKILRCLGYGCISTKPGFSDGERLKKINTELNKIIKQYNPKVMAVENIYFFKNLKTAFPVSQAKGVILFTAAKKKIPIYEFTPLQIKMAITGYGKADKQQIQKMIKVILNLKELPKPDDAADALATAVCYTNL